MTLIWFEMQVIHKLLFCYQFWAAHWAFVSRLYWLYLWLLASQQELLHVRSVTGTAALDCGPLFSFHPRQDVGSWSELIHSFMEAYVESLLVNTKII